MGVPVPGQQLILIEGATDGIIRVQMGLFRKGVTVNGQFNQQLFDGIEFAMAEYGWDTEVHTIPQIFVDWLAPTGGWDVKLDAILADIDLPNNPNQTIGAKVGSL